MIAYGNLRGSLQTIDASGQAVDQIPQNLASLMSSVNETCNDFVTFGIGRKTSFLVGTLGRRSIPAISLRNAIQPHLSSIINYVSLLNPTPKSDSCAINILTKFNTFYKPLVDDNVDRAENVIAQFPQLGENITASIALNKPIFTTLINKINACFKIKSDASRLTCVQQLVSFVYNLSLQKLIFLLKGFLLHRQLFCENICSEQCISSASNGIYNVLSASFYELLRNLPSSVRISSHKVT